jgi:predicted RNA binding protein YcfA (HicA-like mRNA interferase family)
MSKIPPHGWKEMVAAFRKAGFEEFRSEGSHIVMVKEGVARPIVIPRYDEIPDFIVSNNLRTAGIGRKSYLELLGLRKKEEAQETTRSLRMAAGTRAGPNALDLSAFDSARIREEFCEGVDRGFCAGSGTFQEYLQGFMSR